MPQRQILPMAETGGLGPIWNEAFDKTKDQLIREKMAGLGGGGG
jgi:hypothetical protein